MISEKDRKILEVLQKRGRMSFRDIAKECGMAESTVRFRVKVLEKEGIILGYKAILNPKKLGLETLASISINLTSKKYLDDVIGKVEVMKEVLFLSNIIGTHDIIAFTACKDIENLDALVNSISKIEGVQGSPRTNIWVNVRKWANWEFPME